MLRPRAGAGSLRRFNGSNKYRDRNERQNVKEDEIIEAQVIDLDLDAEDIRLRETVGKSTLVRIRGMVVEIQHANEWSTTAMAAVNSGDWHAWAEEVISVHEQFEHFKSCNLKNYQMKAIFERVQKDAGLDLGKSRESVGSSLATRTT